MIIKVKIQIIVPLPVLDPSVQKSDAYISWVKLIFNSKLTTTLP